MKSSGERRARTHNPRRKASSDHTSGEYLWLISLSDLMMLLFVFFVVMFSFAAKRLRAIDYQHITQAFANKPAAEVKTPVDEIQAQLLKWVTDRKLLDAVEVSQKEDSLILEIREKMLFESGEAQLKDQAAEVIPALREALTKIPAPYRIGIEGHTDDEPVAGSSSDNWKLSTERALTVRAALNLPKELEERTVVMGYGSTRPLAPNRDTSGHPDRAAQARNRRVTIRVF